VGSALPNPPFAIGRGWPVLPARPFAIGEGGDERIKRKNSFIFNSLTLTLSDPHPIPLPKGEGAIVPFSLWEKG
jgi:hypothetical protein